MNPETTTWAEVTAFLRELALCCCRTDEGWVLPSPEGWSAEREAAVDLWIRKKLGRTLARPIPPEIRWGLLQRARAAGSLAATAAHHHEPEPKCSLPRMLDSLLLEMAGKLPVPELPPHTPPWLE